MVKKPLDQHFMNENHTTLQGEVWHAGYIETYMKNSAFIHMNNKK